jgi:hypothetical protein
MHPEAAIALFAVDGPAMVGLGLTHGIPVVSIGTRWALEGFLACTAVYRTGRATRNDRPATVIPPGRSPTVCGGRTSSPRWPPPIVVDARL